MGLFLIALWMTRHHLKRVFSAAIKGTHGETADEPMSYRTALIGLIFVFGSTSLFLSSGGDGVVEQLPLLPNLLRYFDSDYTDASGARIPSP